MSKIYIFIILFFSLISCKEDNWEGNIPVLELETQTVDFPIDGGYKSIIVNTNKDNWTIKADIETRSWCDVSKEIGEIDKLNITVLPNPDYDKREGIITLELEGLTVDFIVRQLGKGKCILVSPETIFLDSKSCKDQFTITSNVEFEISSDDWITVDPLSESRSISNYDYVYSVTRNTGSRREGFVNIIESGIMDNPVSAMMIITQEAMEGYKPEDSNIKEDIEVPIHSGNAVNSKGQETHHGQSTFDRAFDGNKDTGYHSSQTQDKYSKNPENWPLDFTFKFENQSRVDYFILTNTNNNRIKDGEIWFATSDNPEKFEKLMDYTFQNKTEVKVVFPQPIINPVAIKIKAKSTTTEYIIIKEIQFYKENPENFDYSTLFTDVTCSELKPGITENEINSCKDPLFKNVAYYMYCGVYPEEFRIRDYKAYPDPAIFKDENGLSKKHDMLDNATGIYVKKNEELIVLVGDCNVPSLELCILDLNIGGKDGFNEKKIYNLKKGINRLVPETDGLVYIIYQTDEYEGKTVRIHIPSGEVNGFFDSRIHKSSDWDRLINAAIAPHFDVLGERAHLIFPTPSLRLYTSDGKKLIDKYDEIVRFEEEFIGLIKYQRPNPHHVCYTVMNNDSYMYAAENHIGIEFGSMDDVCNSDVLSDNVWGVAHETGHTYQHKPGLCWHGMTEVTANIPALYVQECLGNSIRLMGKRGDYTSYYENAMSWYFPNETPHIRKLGKIDEFCQLIPFWQLYLYINNVSHNDSFYQDLYEIARTNDFDVNDPGQIQLDFTLNASKISKLNLTDFFRYWGFYAEVDYELSDYGNKKRFRVSREMVEKTISDIENLGYSKPNKAIEYICEANLDIFKEGGNIVKGSAKRNDRIFIMTGWQNTVAFEVWSDGKLCFVSPSSVFTIPEELPSDDEFFPGKFKLGNNIEVYGISVYGERIKADLN